MSRTVSPRQEWKIGSRSGGNTPVGTRFQVSEPVAREEAL